MLSHQLITKSLILILIKREGELWLWKSNEFLASEGEIAEPQIYYLLCTEYGIVMFQGPHPYCVKSHVLVKMRMGYNDQPYPRKCGSKPGYPLVKHHVRPLAPGPWPVPPIVTAASKRTNQMSYIAYIGAKLWPIWKTPCRKNTRN